MFYFLLSFSKCVYKFYLKKKKRDNEMSINNFGSYINDKCIF